MNGDDNLQSTEAYPLTKARRSQSDEAQNALEKRSFLSVNSSIGWVGVNASPACAVLNSTFEQLSPLAKERDLVSQRHALRELKKHGTLTNF